MPLNSGESDIINWLNRIKLQQSERLSFRSGVRSWLSQCSNTRIILRRRCRTKKNFHGNNSHGGKMDLQLSNKHIKHVVVDQVKSSLPLGTVLPSLLLLILIPEIDANTSTTSYHRFWMILKRRKDNLICRIYLDTKTGHIQTLSLGHYN